MSDSTANSEDLGTESDSDESSEYSDWIADHGVSLEPPKRSKRRRVPRKPSPTPSPPPKKKNKETVKEPSGSVVISSRRVRNIIYFAKVTLAFISEPGIYR